MTSFAHLFLQVVRVWFCNRRQKEKRINPPSSANSSLLLSSFDESDLRLNQSTGSGGLLNSGTPLASGGNFSGNVAASSTQLAREIAIVSISSSSPIPNSQGLYFKKEDVRSTPPSNIF